MWGLEQGYCMMIGGEAQGVKRLDLIFRRLAPGHFVKMYEDKLLSAMRCQSGGHLEKSRGKGAD